ncbi:MAG: LytR/AlgR family response regulator transcription factor [Oceanicaulis sp.]
MSPPPTRSVATPALEQRVLRNAFLFYALVSTGFWLVNGLSLAEEWRRAGDAGGWVRALTLEGTSHVIILALFFPVAWLERRIPPTLGNWRTALPAHFVASAVFAVVHVGAMNLVRGALWPLLFDRAYTAGVWTGFIYEYRKDLLSYALMLAVLALFRAREEAEQRAAAVSADARRDHVVTLRCGGREIRLPADEIVSASAAGNYAEVATRNGAHLARTTLAELERLLTEAGADPVRVHRSHLVARGAVREVVPAGGGDAEAVLLGGARLPVSRRYRDRLSG